MTTQDPSRQQNAERSQSGSGVSQQGAGAVGQRTQSQGAHGQPGAQGGAYGRSPSTQPDRQAGAPDAGYGQPGRQGSGQARYGMPERGRQRGYEASPFGSAAGAGPFTLMRRISEEMDRLFENFGTGRNFFPEEMAQGPRGGSAQRGASLWSPHLEVFERNGKLLVQVDLPGVRREDVNVHIEPDAVIIQGERTQQNERSGQGYYHSERSYGSFYRTVPLPEGVDIEQANATFRDGVLEIELPMPQQQPRGRRLEVRDAGSSAGTTYQGDASSAGSGSASGGGTYHGGPSSTAGGAASGGGGEAASGTSVGGEHGSSGTR
jgi:HSP20 family protein